MPRLPLLLGLALGAALAGGCDWTKFDDLALKAGIRAVTRPGDMDSNLYPSAVLPVAKPRGNAELLVLGADNVSLADFTFGPDGHMGTQTVSSARFLLNGTKTGPLAAQKVADRDYTLAAYLEDPGDDVPRVVTVLKDDRQPLLVTLDSATANFAVTTLGGPLPFEAGAIAVGSARGAGTDVVVASSELVVIPYASPDPIERCDLDAAVRAMAVGDQWIAVGQSDGIGQVWVLTPPYDAPDADCPQQAPLAGFTESVGFGTALLAADVVNDDGVRELIVSAPAERTVYVYDPADVTTALARYTVPGGSTSCGSAIAVGTVERTLTLVLGDPDYVGELESPGVVWLQDLETPGADPQPLLSPNSEDILRFGQQVGVLSFTGPEGPVDLVWATAEAVTAGDPGVLYLFFWVNSADADPRVLKE